MLVGQVDDSLLASLGERVAASVLAWRPQARVTGLRPLTGGTSSLTFLVDFDGIPVTESPVVLKVAPPGLEPVRNRDVLRQARLLAALEERKSGLAPAMLFSDAGDPPEVPPFMAMDLVAGECVEPIFIPAAERIDKATAHARYLDAAAVLARLHSIPPSELGLTGEPVVTLESEIERWTRAFETLPEPLQGDYRSVADALHASIPDPVAPVVNHGDFRLGNTLCEGGRVTAVIDWEIWSVGDPRIDVSWMLFFADDGGHPGAEPGPPAGSPAGAELVSVYESVLGTRLTDLDWFRALTHYKEAGLTGLLLKRADKDGTTLKPALARMRPALPRLLREALDLLGH